MPKFREFWKAYFIIFKALSNFQLKPYSQIFFEDKESLLQKTSTKVNIRRHWDLIEILHKVPTTKKFAETRWGGCPVMTGIRELVREEKTADNLKIKCLRLWSDEWIWHRMGMCLCAGILQADTLPCPEHPQTHISKRGEGTGMTVPHNLSTWEVEAEDAAQPGLHNIFGVALLCSAPETSQDWPFSRFSGDTLLKIGLNWFYKDAKDRMCKWSLTAPKCGSSSPHNLTQLSFTTVNEKHWHYPLGVPRRRDKGKGLSSWFNSSPIISAEKSLLNKYQVFHVEKGDGDPVWIPDSEVLRLHSSEQASYTRVWAGIPSTHSHKARLAMLGAHL